MDDIQKYAAQYSHTTKGEEVEYEIEPFVDEENDTLFYAVKFDKGFKIIASDKRVNPILIEEEEDSYESLRNNKPAWFWTRIMSAEMKEVKHTSDEDLKIPKEEQEYYKKYWASFCDTDAYVRSLLPDTKIEEFPDYSGYYYLVSSTTTYENLTTVNHLMSTRWHQSYPFNYYCPTRTDSTSLQAYAGCVAIAGAQVLYYFHNYWGVPTTAPSQAYCYSSVGDYPLNMGQGTPSSTVWGLMNGTTTDVAPFVANVAQLANTQFGNNGSGALLSDLEQNAFPSYGIACNYSSTYSDASFHTSLVSGVPVIVGANGNHYYDPFGFEHFLDGHAFVIDGYEGYNMIVTKVYRWAYNTPNQPFPLPLIDDIIEVTTSPYINYIWMNWGWGPNDSNYNTKFALTGSWGVVHQGHSMTFDYNRDMITNFHIIGN